MKKILIYIIVLFAVFACNKGENEQDTTTSADFSLSIEGSGVVDLDGMKVPSKNNRSSGVYNNSNVPSGVSSLRIIAKSDGNRDVEQVFDLSSNNNVLMSSLYLGSNIFEAFAEENTNNSDAWIKRNFNGAPSYYPVLALIKDIPLYREYYGQARANLTQSINSVNLEMLNKSAVAAFKFGITNLPSSYYLNICDKTTGENIFIDNSSVYVLNPKSFKIDGVVPDIEIRLFKGNMLVRTALLPIKRDGYILVNKDIQRNCIYFNRMSIDCSEIKTTGDFTLTWDTNFIISDWTTIDINWKTNGDDDDD